MNQTCPNCGWHLNRQNHPVVGLVRFCRQSCIRIWKHAHGVPVDERDPLPIAGDRRMAVAR